MTRARVIVPVLIIAGAMAWIATQGLAGNVVYYRTPSEVVREAAAGERLRLGGYVEPGSIRETGRGLEFLVTDGRTRVTVVRDGGVPTLFREGQGVVVEGIYGADGAFHADNVLVRHDSDYQPPAAGETPHSATLEDA
jgi:cytochrome c-type biogenesis protein CcmE